MSDRKKIPNGNKTKLKSWLKSNELDTLEVDTSQEIYVVGKVVYTRVWMTDTLGKRVLSHHTSDLVQPWE